MAGPVPMGPFTMPMYREFVPKAIRPWIYLMFAFIFQMSGGIYLGSLSQMVGSTTFMREDIMMVQLFGLVGINMPFPVLFRLKFRFTNRQLLLFHTSVLIVCNLLCMWVTWLPLLCVLSYIAGFFKLCATFECMSNIQLWMTPKRDFTIFFPLLYCVVLGNIALSGWLAQQLTYYYGSWYMMHWLMVGLLLVVFTLIFTLTKNFRFMKPLPLISVDWLGCILWSAVCLEVLFLFNYGEYYNWWDGMMFRYVTYALPVTLYLCIGRMCRIRHPYIAAAAWKYKNLLPLLVLFFVTEWLNATPKVLQNAFTGNVLHWGFITTSVFNLIEYVGYLLGCMFVMFWVKVLHQKFTRLLTVGFMGLLAYQVIMYFNIDPRINIELFYLPIILRSFGYAIYFTALTIYLVDLFPFQYFFMGLTMVGFVRDGVAETICTGIYGFCMRHHMADNIVRSMPYDMSQTLMVSIKQLFGVTCIIGVAILLFMLLWDIQPIRSTLKKMPYWNAFGRQIKKQLKHF